MFRTMVTKSEAFLLIRNSRAVKRRLSKLAGVARAENSCASSNNIHKRDDPPYWVPHPRTKIYFPQGHERVMDDVPDSAASFGQTYWLRNVDGVEKPDPDDDASADNRFCTNQTQN